MRNGRAMNTALVHGHALYANATPSQQVVALAAMLFVGASFVSLLTAFLSRNIAIWKGTPHLHTDLLHNFGLGGLAA